MKEMHLQILKNAHKELEEQGFTKLEGFFSKHETNTYLNEVSRGIEDCARDIDCSPHFYLQSVSRWLSPSPPLHNIEEEINRRLHVLVSDLFKHEAKNARTNLICKTFFARASTPLHQDISYSPQSPYKLTTWVSLNDISEESAPLIFAPKSHLLEIEAPVDFWSPEYKDIKKEKFVQSTGIVSVPAKQGDIILFDSSLWHGSHYNQAGKDRYAIVSRWTYKDFTPHRVIPPQQPLFFGMWNCSQMTQDILKSALRKIEGNESDEVEEIDKLIKIWQDKLKTLHLPFPYNSQKTLHALEKVRILDLASKRHNGGDGQGTIYAELWHVFLKRLADWMEQ
jgi:ectoine hydroxylase-related dioxygenase (phytanoyl-CoA dioxygenase family)